MKLGKSSSVKNSISKGTCSTGFFKHLFIKIGLTKKEKSSKNFYYKLPILDSTIFIELPHHLGLHKIKLPNYLADGTIMEVCVTIEYHKSFPCGISTSAKFGEILVASENISFL